MVNDKQIPDLHRFCFGCVWGTWFGSFVYCPFPVGMCAKIPSTREQPDPELLHDKMVKYALKERRKRK